MGCWGWLLPLLALLSAPAARAGFVQRCGAQLCLDGSAFYFQGANSYWLVDYVKGNPSMIDDFFDHCNTFGLKVIRLWAFNHRMPYAAGQYDEDEFTGLDYIIDAAGRKGIKLILAIGNTWTAYRSPQDFMRLAGVDPDGKDLLDFYGSPELREFYKAHITSIVTRLNTINGLRYADDGAIMMWDVLNEPRCPGCMDSASQATHQSFLQEMAAHLKTQAPSQLAALGTEGYFMNSHEGANPGAGARCEAEDWVKIVSDNTAIDVAVVHVYERQMESVPPQWTHCDFTCFVNYMVQYLKVHEDVCSGLGKPLVMEEYGAILPAFTAEERVQLFRLVADLLDGSKSSGGPLMGAMFWNAAMGAVNDDGYNIYLDGPITTPPPVAAVAGATPAPEAGPSRAPIQANTEGLTDFLRGPARQACAAESAAWWLPDWTAASAQTVDCPALAQRCSGLTVLQVLLDSKDNVYG